MSRRSTNVISEKNTIGNKVEGDCNAENTEASKPSMSVVKIKTEPNCDIVDQTCTVETTTISTELGSSNSVYEQHKSIGTSSTSSDARLDLGTHLKDSLSSMVSNEKLTWSNLLQGGSLPKVHIPENTVTIKKENVDSNSPDVVICSTDDDTTEENPSGRNDEKVQGEKRSATVKNGSYKDLTVSSNKNISTSGDGNDANKKVIPPQIRRVLASKFGVLKRYEDGQPGGIAPNLTKSRSRFIQCLKPNVVNNSEEGKSLSSSDVEETHKKPGDDKDDDVESPPKCRSVSPFHNLANPTLAGKLSNRRRFSSSAYEGRGVPAFIKKEPPSEVDYNFGLQSGSWQRISSLMPHSSYSSNVNSSAPLDTENMIDLRSSARNWKNRPTKAKLNETVTKGNNSYGMINLNTSPYSMNFGTSGDRIPFSGKPRYAHKSRESSSKQRSSSRSPVHNERSVVAETQQPMIELSSNSRKFNSFAPGMTRSEEGRKSISPVRPERWHYDKARSVSPVMNDTRGNRSPYKPRTNDESDRQTGALREAATRINKEATVRYHNRLSPKGNHVTKSPPMIELRSTTRSLDQSVTNKSTSDNRMIDLNHTSRIHERRGAPVMKPINAMIDLNSTDNPASPSSPGFGLNLHSNFPSQAYRSCNRGLRYPAYKPQRGRVPLVASPGFSPRIQYGGTHFNYPPSPLYHVADRPTDFGSPKKQTKLPNKPSNLSIEQGEESKHVQKRPNSTDLSNANMPVKRQRIETDQNYEGRGVALNVVDLLELEREEQKYIQELSIVQSRVTSTQFKIQRLQQELEQLQTTEADLKRRIDVVRAKRVRILTDAQEKHGFQREEKSSPSKIAGKESKNVLMKQDEEELKPRNESRYDGGKNMTGRKESDKFDSMDDKGGFHHHHMETDDAMKKSDCDDGDGKLRDTWGSKSHLGGTVKDIDNSSKGYHKMNHNETRAVSPNVVLHNAPIFSDPRSSTDFPSVPHWQEETFEGSNGSLITLRSDGTVILGKRQTHHASLHKKHTHSAVLKDIKVTSLDVRSTSGDVTEGKVPYFSGCVEITSTTEEPVLRESEPPKEVIAEKERASLASAISSK
ncbi:uncharacterized protein LOC124452533 isoform X2 [Xenia sp. Carnegie-2017]|uniref:uncharacterized protein LOC124452533 isoform X2 n=1 Tax=Xenia sp. Carnegie-2017 TaxID=2897299 RepID=UPI001F038B7B|nr:uncharacterized protein LOC124452533 isoform X2 [Xenia sp. Carnegie-2017]